MNLVIDIGNHRCKIAVFDNNELLEVHATEESPLEAVDRFVEKYKPEKSILSSVVVTDEALIRRLSLATTFVQLSTALPLPLKNNYGTPSSLGTDRLAAVMGSKTIAPNRNVLTINGGTCVTFDLLTADGAYKGGAISPGLNMRFAALNTFTDKLPLISFDENFEALIGTSTQESILSGVQNGLIAELEGVIIQYSEVYENLVVVVCGGDSNFFVSRLKNSIFAHNLIWQPHLVLIGLNAILNYQYV
ncbi:type III pantothenate kinase [Solitalea koreensis]|uniref:Type III pantothenate kinase n=1 Tax=Solitalea koreensis TaxID=543615 RepID=A0A521CMX0_9SPHI|nr:type III pantothenate kinase [Solitalea koreensis]SMO60802.1 type III pantothenate kinase [Solitalea koreensis]